MSQSAMDLNTRSASRASQAEDMPLRGRVEAEDPYWRAEIQAADGAWRRFHSTRDPLAEARHQLASLVFGDSNTVVVLGGGLNYLADVLFEQADGRRVIVVEPCAELARAALRRRDWMSLLQAGRLELRGWPAINEPAPLWQLFDRDEPEPVLFAHPVLEREYPALVARMHATIRKIVFEGRANADARRRQAGPYLINTLQNLAALADSIDTGRLAGALAGMPTVLVGAGPSLDDHLDTLRRIQDRAVIIAVDTALRPLANAGVRPHLAIALDPTELNARHLLDLPDTSDTWLVAEPSLMPAALARFVDRLFTFRVANHHPWPWLAACGVTRQLVKVWGSVLTAALDLAVLTGADPIVFVGSDLAFTNGRPYCRGALWEEMWAHATGRGRSIVSQWADDIAGRPVEHVADLHGRETRTTRHHLAFRDWLLARMAAVADRRFINASGEGILFGPPLAVESFREDLFPPAPVSASVRERFATWRREARAGSDACRARLSSSLHELRAGTVHATRDAWLAFGQATIGPADLDRTLLDATRALDRQASTPEVGTPRPAGLLPAADRAARLHAALCAPDRLLDETSGDHAHPVMCDRTLELLRMLVTDSCLDDVAPRTEADLTHEAGTVPVSLLFDLPVSLRHALTLFEDHLARACPDALADRPSGKTTATRAHALPAEHSLDLVRRLLAEQWLAVARFSADHRVGLDAPATVHWALRALVNGDTPVFARDTPALVLQIAGDVRVPLPTPDALPRELSGLLGVRPIATAPTSAAPIILRRAASNSIAPWLQIFDGPVLRVYAETLTPERIDPAGLATTLDDHRALVTPLGALASLEIDRDMTVVARPEWPRPIWGERSFGPSGGAIAWHNPDRVVLVREHAGAPAMAYDAPFRPLRMAVPDDGVPIWCAFEGGLWRWWPGQGDPERLVDTSVPIHLHLQGDGSIQVHPATRQANGAPIRTRLTMGWQWKPGSAALETITLGPEGQCTSIESANGWIATAYPYADLVHITTPDGTILPLGVYYPLTVAWAGGSLIVCTGDLEVLCFRDLAERIAEAHA